MFLFRKSTKHTTEIHTETHLQNYLTLKTVYISDVWGAGCPVTKQTSIFIYCTVEYLSCISCGSCYAGLLKYAHNICSLVIYALRTVIRLQQINSINLTIEFSLSHTQINLIKKREFPYPDPGICSSDKK